MENNVEVSEFILLVLTSAPELQLPLFFMFTLIYLLTLAGNLGMITLILLDSPFHTPMYFFLSNLSLVDFCSSLAVTPKVMAGLLMEDKVISYNACAAQMFFFVLQVTVESYLLSAMACDGYAAVCKSLHHPPVMTTRVCAHLAVCCYILGFLTAAIGTGDTVCLSFCASSVTHHFFCDIPAVMTLACSDKHLNELIIFLISSFNVFLALLVIWVSYLLIFNTILKTHSVGGYQKALFTCASHLMAVSIFYGTIIIIYLQRSSSHSMDTDNIASVFYTVVISMLNPVVYSLRNKEVKSAFKKVVEQAKYSQVLVF